MFLNSHSYHSLRYGTLSVEDLVSLAVEFGVKELVLTDINTVTGIYHFKKECEKVGIKPIVGVEIRKNNKLLYVGIAKNFQGIAELNTVLTNAHCLGKELDDRAPDFENVYVIYPLENCPDEELKADEFLGIRPSEINLLIRTEFQKNTSQMVVLHSITFRKQKDYNLHKILRAIDLNTLISKLNNEDYCQSHERFCPIDEVLNGYTFYPQLIDNTRKILNSCDFQFDFSVPRNKKHYTQSKEDDLKLLRHLTYIGMEKRYTNQNVQAKQRIEKELKVIDDLNFSGYFLITWDIIRYSNSMGFMHVGRGSGANSIVSYCLGITDVCPIELDLYFERFLNANRKSPPDFDIDWSWQQRDVIIEYIFNRYGKDHVAFCGTNVAFKYRSIFRELGKAFGLPKEDLDRLAKQPIENHDQNPVVLQIQKYAQMLEYFPNQRSMHACGILISEEPITQFSALDLPPKGFPVVQFDMHTAEDIGFEKFDILSQRGLGTIDDTVKLIKENQGITVDIRDPSLSKNESKTNELLKNGDTLGCFYIESPAMRGLLKKLKCDHYKTLVAASSIIRPGVAKSGMMKAYIFRHNHPNQFDYIHQVFKEHLGETYGIMVYQEDVIKIALHFGGLSAADGDILRRAMSGKGRSLQALQEVKNHFFDSCKKRGHSESLSQEVYRQIESFAGYSFCKAHSASYAVESYQCLYLKAYYPLEFMVSVINNMGGFYRTEIYVHEARMSGALIENPCINRSGYQTTLQGTKVFLGFMHLQQLESTLAFQILEERKNNGDFQSLEDFVRRICIGIESLQLLIFIGAFRFTGKQKNELLIEARLLMVNFKPEQRGLLLLEEPQQEYALPELKREIYEDAFDEIDLLGFPVSCSVFDLLQTKFRGSVFSKDLLEYHHKEVKMIGFLVTRKYVPTQKGIMYFGTWIDVQGAYFDSVHFPDQLKKFPFQGEGCYLMLGVVDVEFGVPILRVLKLAKLPYITDPRYGEQPSKSSVAVKG